jgi:hypothetical protein
VGWILDPGWVFPSRRKLDAGEQKQIVWSAVSAAAFFMLSDPFPRLPEAG